MLSSRSTFPSLHQCYSSYGQATFTSDVDGVIFYEFSPGGYGDPYVSINGTQVQNQEMQTVGKSRLVYGSAEVKQGDVIAYQGNRYGAVDLFLFIYE